MKYLILPIIILILGCGPQESTVPDSLIYIYPNPAYKSAYVSLNNVSTEEYPAKFIFTDTKGDEIFSRMLEAGEQYVSLQMLEEELGVYTAVFEGQKNRYIMEVTNIPRK